MHVLNERGDVGMPGRTVCARQKKQHVAAKRCESILENQSFPGWQVWHDQRGPERACRELNFLAMMIDFNFCLGH